jgi:hypothetical protein
MNRRERHTRIIESWGNLGHSYLRFHFDNLIARRGLSALTDEAIRELATDLVRSRARQNKMNAENRKNAERRAQGYVETSPGRWLKAGQIYKGV